MRTALRTFALVMALLAAACGVDGGGGPGGGSVSPPAEGACPEATSLEVASSEDGTFTLDVVSEFAIKTLDDSLYGDYWSAGFADFEVEPSTSVQTEDDQRAVTLEIFNRDQTLPAPGTFDFKGTQNTYFQPYFQTGGTSQPVTTIGDGGTLTITVASDEELCGSLDVSDSSLTIRGVFRAAVEPDE